jgi:hypothetical protein
VYYLPRMKHSVWLRVEGRKAVYYLAGMLAGLVEGLRSDLMAVGCNWVEECKWGCRHRWSQFWYRDR